MLHYASILAPPHQLQYVAELGLLLFKPEAYASTKYFKISRPWLEKKHQCSSSHSNRCRPMLCKSCTFELRIQVELVGSTNTRVQGLYTSETTLPAPGGDK